MTASWSSSNAFVSGARGLRFKSCPSQIRHSVANRSPHCDISSKEAVLLERNDASDGPCIVHTHYKLQHNRISIKKELILI